MDKTLHISPDGLVDQTHRHGLESIVTRKAGYTNSGHECCFAEDTGNGFIVHFPSDSSTRQDYYVCLDYAQARDLVLALSEHKTTLGFKDHP